MSMKATRDAYGEWLVEAGRRNPDVVVLDADLSESTKTNLFAREFPGRFFDVGAAEQNLVAVSAGFAKTGKRVFASSFAIFETGRAWEQIRNFVAHDSLNVALVASHSGLSCAADGASHQALEDVALMRVVPNMRVVAPCDAEETRSSLDAFMASDGPIYVRLRREKEPILQKSYEFKLGRAGVMREGSDVTLVASGASVSVCLKAAEKLREAGFDAGVLNVHTIKPLDEEAVVKAAGTGIVVTVEEHSVVGGLGGTVSEALSELKPTPIRRIGVRDSFGLSARTYEEILERFHLTPAGVAAETEAFIRKNRK